MVISLNEITILFSPKGGKRLLFLREKFLYLVFVDH